MKFLRCFLIAVVVILAALCWVGPAAVVYFAKTAPAATRVVPTELKDVSTSPAPGRKISYFGYEFEVPWSDLDESQPDVSEESNLNTVWLHFRSGLKLFVVITPPEAGVPEYALTKRVYEATPDKVHYWSLIQGRGYQEARLLLFKWALLQSIGHPFKALVTPEADRVLQKQESSTSIAKATRAFSTVILEADPTYSNCASTPMTAG